MLDEKIERMYPNFGKILEVPAIGQRMMSLSGTSVVRDCTRPITQDEAHQIFVASKAQYPKRLKAWVENFRQNRVHLRTGKATAEWFPQNLHAGKAAVIVGAGPSLEKNAHLLNDPEFRKLAVVITQNKSLRFVQNPDYYLSIDYEGRRDWYNDAAGNPLDLSQTTAIVNILARSKIAERNWKQVRFFKPMEKYQFSGLKDLNQYDRMGLLDSGWHCTFSAAQLAHHLGCAPIIFIGCDYSFPGERLHAGDEKKIDNKHTDFINKGLKMVDAWSGQPVWTHRIYLNAMFSLASQLFFISQQTPVINASEAGILQDIPLFEFILAKNVYQNGRKMHVPVSPQNPILRHAKLWPKIMLYPFSQVIAGIKKLKRQYGTFDPKTLPLNQKAS